MKLPSSSPSLPIGTNKVIDERILLIYQVEFIPWRLQVTGTLTPYEGGLRFWVYKKFSLLEMERIVGLGRELDLGYGADLDETHWLIALAEQWSFTVLA